MVRPPADPAEVTGLPADVALVHAFVNSLDLREYRVHGKRMTPGDAWEGGPAALARWLDAHGLPAGEDPDAFERAVRLRAALRDSTCQTAPEEPAPLADLPLLVTVGVGAGPRLVSAAAGVDAALARILITAVDLSARGLWARLRMCLADDCRWIFYDRSRPGRGRWCSPQLCGNRFKIRAHREGRRDSLPM